MFLIQYWTSPFANLINIRAFGFALEDIMLKLKPILIFDVIYNFTNCNVMIYHPHFTVLFMYVSLVLCGIPSLQPRCLVPRLPQLSKYLTN